MVFKNGPSKIYGRKFMENLWKTKFMEDSQVT